MNAPHVKQFVEERDRTVNLMIDMSASGYFGSRGTTKRELAAELAAVVAFSAIKNNDRVGLYIVTDKVERYVPPKKGRRHVLRVIGEILAFEPTSRKTDLATGLDFLGKVARRRSRRVPRQRLPRRTAGSARCGSRAQRHELVPVVVGDPLEQALPTVGLLVLEDLETGRGRRGRHERARARRSSRSARSAAADARDQALRRINLDIVEVDDEPAVRRRADRVLQGAREEDGARR